MSEYSKSTITEQIISSCSGALITSVFVTPFDVVKIRLQVQSSSTVKKKCYLHYSCLWDNLCYCLQQSHCKRCDWYKCNTHFKGTWDAFSKITKYEGITALWSGLPPTLIMSVPATMIYFTMYEQIRDLSLSKLVPPLQSHYIPLLAGAAARVLTVTAISPIEFLRTKMQSEKIKYSDVGKSVYQLVERRGFLSLWHGYIPTLLRDVPFSALYWTMYEQLKQLEPNPQIFHYFIFGAVSGTVAATLTLPFDVIKTQRQTELGEAALLNRTVQSSTLTLIHNLYKKNGVTSLFAGLVPRILKVAPSCAIMISSYEFGKAYFRKQKIKRIAGD